MNSVRVKKISMSISVVLALILFFCLYFINYNNEKTEDSNVQVTEPEEIATTIVPIKDTMLRENKNIYNRYRLDRTYNAYINVFSSKDKDGRTSSFSDFDLIANWDEDNSPVLDANVRLIEKGKQFNEKAIDTTNASIRVRGNPGASLKSYRIKITEDMEQFEGQSVLNIDKNLNDPSRIANKLAHDLIKDLRHISGFRTNFLEVYIRDDSLDGKKLDYNPYGLYTHIEQPNKTYLKSHGLDENGTIYRAKDFTFQLVPQLRNVDDNAYDESLFETVLAIREGNDHTKLIKMLEDINDDSKNFTEMFNTYFNEENYLTWLSINILLGNVDAMSEGFLLYSPSDSLGFYLLPWDFDGIFKWMKEDSNEANMYDCMNEVVFHRKYLQIDGSVEKLRAKLDELVSNTFSPKKVKSLVQQYKPILLDMMNKFPDDILMSIPLNELIAYLDYIDEEILLNYNEFIRQYE